MTERIGNRNPTHRLAIIRHPQDVTRKLSALLVYPLGEPEAELPRRDPAI